MKYFFGNHDKAIDKKGRALIPAGFRTALGDQSRTIYALPSLDPDRPCKVIWSEIKLEETVEKMTEHFHDMDPLELDGLKVMIAGGIQLTIDENGRIQLPAPLISELDLTDTVIFAGDGPYFSMWEPGHYQAYLGRILKAGRFPGGNDLMLSLASRSLPKRVPAPSANSGDSQGNEQ